MWCWPEWPPSTCHRPLSKAPKESECFCLRIDEAGHTSFETFLLWIRLWVFFTDWRISDSCVLRVWQAKHSSAKSCSLSIPGVGAGVRRAELRAVDPRTHLPRFVDYGHLSTPFSAKCLLDLGGHFHVFHVLWSPFSYPNSGKLGHPTCPMTVQLSLTTKDDVSLKVYLLKLFAGAKATRKRKCCPQDCFFPLHSFKTIGFPDIFTYMCWVFHWNSHQSWSMQMSCEQWGWKPMAFFCGLCRKIGLRRTIRGIYAMRYLLPSSCPCPPLCLPLTTMACLAPLCRAGNIQVCSWLQHARRMWNSLPRSALGGQSTASIVNNLYNQEAIRNVTKRWLIQVDPSICRSSHWEW